eukprot:gene3345-6619_t
MENYQKPSIDERSLGQNLAGRHIDIFWDGDNVYYPATIIGYSSEKKLYTVRYDEGDEEFEEDLANIEWRLWNGTEEEYHALKAAQVTEQKEKEKAAKNQRVAKMTYQAMVMEAVVNLDERGGSSLKAIRKYIQSNFILQKQQPASFNSLTLKAVTKVVSTGELERIKRNTFRLSVAEKERRRKRFSGLFEAGGDASSGYRAYDILGTHTENNKALRKELHEARERRDAFLERQLDLLLPFLPDK